MKYVNCQALLGANSVNQNGFQIDSSKLASASFQFVFGDKTSVGTCAIQASNDLCYDGYQALGFGSGGNSGTFVVTNWTNIPSQSVVSTSGASALLTISNCSYRWLRATYTASSGGSSTVTANMDAISL